MQAPGESTTNNLLELVAGFIAKVGFANTILLWLVWWLTNTLSGDIRTLTAAVQQLAVIVERLPR